MNPVSGVKRVATVGIAEPLSPVPMLASRLHVEAIFDNTDLIYIGGKETHAGQRSGASMMGDSTNKKPGGFVFENVDLANVWVASLVAAEGVSWMAEIG